MHFIHLTRPTGKPTTVNMDMVSEMIDVEKKGQQLTMVLFNFQIGDDYGYTEVRETRAEILAKCR